MLYYTLYIVFVHSIYIVMNRSALRPFTHISLDPCYTLFARLVDYSLWNSKMWRLIDIRLRLFYFYVSFILLVLVLFPFPIQSHVWLWNLLFLIRWHFSLPCALSYILLHIILLLFNYYSYSITSICINICALRIIKDSFRSSKSKISFEIAKSVLKLT